MKRAISTILTGSILVANAMAATIAFENSDHSKFACSSLASFGQSAGSPGDAGNVAPAELDPDIVVFSAENGCGCFVSDHLDDFALQSLNVVFDSAWESMLQAPGIAADQPLKVTAVPEAGGPLIGGFGLLLLLLRRRPRAVLVIVKIAPSST